MWTVAGAWLAAASPVVAEPTPAAVEAVIARYRQGDAPGCAAAVARNGAIVVDRAFGLAHLEHPAPNTPATILETGSAAKQFTAAAALILVEENRLSLDDDVRRYLPEMPDYGTPITIDHLLTHSSGLRDWRALFAIAGWPLGSRVTEPADVLDIASRQRGLNHAPGAEYSYTNTGYSLLALIIERVAGQSLADFTRDRIFRPLGMSATSWRDDFTRLVPGRATAYRRQNGNWVQDMPFENAHGAGGLLTTTGDLLRWNIALDEERLGRRVTQRLQERARLSDGRENEYARGLIVGSFRGTPEIGHGGETRSYRAWVGRYPAHRLGVAVLCNSGQADPIRLARDLASLFVPASPVAGELPATPLPPVTPRPRWTPSTADLAAFTGRYASEEVGSAFVVSIEDGRLRMAVDRRPGVFHQLSPVGRDAFVFGGGRTEFSRNASGQIVALSVTVVRARAIRFDRVRNDESR